MQKSNYFPALMNQEHSIYTKIIGIMADIDAIGKGHENKQQNYTFRGIDDMYNELHRHFVKHGVFITSEIIHSERSQVPTKSGGLSNWSIVDYKFRFYASDGSFVETIQRGEAMDSGDKASNKSASTALKYALMQMLLIPTLEEKDTEASSPEIVGKPIPKTTAGKTAPQTHKELRTAINLICKKGKETGKIPEDELQQYREALPEIKASEPKARNIYNHLKNTYTELCN